VTKPSGLPSQIELLLASLPKAELHVHLEGSIEPWTAVELAARHGTVITEAEVAARYAPGTFLEFLEAFKWVTSFLQTPADYALITERFCEELLAQNIVYAEVTLSVGVMFRRKQDPAFNFEAIRQAARPFEAKGLRIRWIFDAVRQFGVAAAEEVLMASVQCQCEGVIAFGMGGDELALPASDFRGVYESAGAHGLDRVVHAGEIGNAQSVQNAVEVLGATRVGHGIAAMNDPRVMDFLIERGVTLEVCPTSNVRTGALARQLAKPSASIQEHQLRLLFERGLQIALSSDDPAMFETTLTNEYLVATQLGLSAESLVRLAQMSFRSAFLQSDEIEQYLTRFDAIHSEWAKRQNNLL
jgi:aminodeoxyfutalosine deaminase